MISFWDPNKENGYLSNFYPSPIELGGNTWRTVEHYFQAHKFPEDAMVTYNYGKTLPIWYHIMCQPLAWLAAKEGERRDFPLLSNWDEIKEDVMLKALHAKFTQHKNLREKLLATGDEDIVEDSPYDYYWGTGENGTGKNRLGILLMQVREELR